QVTVVIGFDQVRQDLRVGFRGENMALGHQAVLEIKIVLNDAIVGNVESSRTIPVVVGIDFARPSMCCPARVADSVFNGSGGASETTSSASVAGSCLAFIWPSLRSGAATGTTPLLRIRSSSSGLPVTISDPDSTYRCATAVPTAEELNRHMAPGAEQ